VLRTCAPALFTSFSRCCASSSFLEGMLPVAALPLLGLPALTIARALQILAPQPQLVLPSSSATAAAAAVDAARCVARGDDVILFDAGSLAKAAAALAHAGHLLLLAELACLDCVVTEAEAVVRLQAEARRNGGPSGVLRRWHLSDIRICPLCTSAIPAQVQLLCRQLGASSGVQ
jgi:hypothetical protein